MDRIFALQQYLKYRLEAGSAHAVHSPFVFELTNSILQDKTPFYVYESIESLRASMLLDQRIIAVTDFGTGGSTVRQRKLKIRSIASRFVQKRKYAQLLFRLVNHFQPQNLLELGTSLGLTSLYLATPNRHSRLFTLEGCPATAQIAAANFSQLGIRNIEQRTGPFDETLPELLKENRPLDFIYIDGNHRLEPTLRYFNACLPFVHEATIVVLDDIYWSREMKMAWDRIRVLEKVQVSVDLYHMGILFFRKGISRQHFRLKF